MSKPMSEKETRGHILDFARINGCEQMAINIFNKIDEAMAHATSKEQKDLIALQGLQEMDMLFRGSYSNLSDITVGQNIGEKALKKFINR